MTVGMEEGDHLYLLEVIVEDVRLDRSRKCATGQLKVSVHFLNFPPLEINKEGPQSCTDDPNEKVPESAMQEDPGEENYTENDQSKKSKSCMFPMCPEKLTSKIGMIPLSVNVFGKECAELPPSVLGTAKIYLSDAFMEAISLAKNQVMLPVTATQQDTYILRDVFGDSTGEVCLYVRLSCFGATAIKTDGFTKGEEDKCDVEPLADVWPRALITGEENMMTPGTGEPTCPMDLKKPVPWRLIAETKGEGRTPYVPADRNASLGLQTQRAPPKRETLTCTCDKVPDIILPGPQPPAVQPPRCECAEILAALRNCQASQAREPSVQQQPLPLVQSPHGGTPPPASPGAAVMTASITPGFQAPVLQQQPPSNPALNGSVGELAPSKMSQLPGDIVPTSEVCGVDLKSKSTKSRSSEEKMSPKQQSQQPQQQLPQQQPLQQIPQQQQQQLQQLQQPQEPVVIRNTSNIEATGNEDSAKRVLEQEVANWDNRKRSIQKEVKKKKKARNIYDYTAGMYPGMVIGHKYCIPTLRLVPRNMGWLWNILELQGKGRGWMPGAITKTVTSNFGHWKKAAGLHGDDNESIGTSLRKKKKAQMRGGSIGGEKSISTGTIKPSLHVHKKDGYYYITVHPAGGDLPPGTKPLSFKVDPRKASSDEVSSDETSDDSFEFEYTTPAALQPPKRVVEKATDSTQYCETDFMPKKKGEAQVTVDDSKKEVETESSKKSKSKSKGKKGKKPKKEKKGKGKKK